jgi:hypothetical protein
MTRNFVKDTGWKKTRASGILALLLYENPEMTWTDIYAWCHANGLDSWRPSVAQSDYSAFVGQNGYVYFEEDFPLPDGWSSLFKKWSNGSRIAELPPLPQPNSAASHAISAAVAAIQPVEVATTVQEAESVQAVAVQEAAAVVPVAVQQASVETTPKPEQDQTIYEPAHSVTAQSAQQSIQSVSNAQNGMIPLLILAALI